MKRQLIIYNAEGKIIKTVDSPYASDIPQKDTRIIVNNSAYSVSMIVTNYDTNKILVYCR